MCLFKYREKRYGKLSLILFALALIAVGGLSIWGGFCAVEYIAHWVKYVLVVLASLLGVGLIVFGLYAFAISMSMINQSKSVRDGNRSKGVTGVRLCDKCGRPISKKAEFCEHCGAKQQTGLGIKTCPECKAENSATAAFCEKCQYEFKD